MHVMPRCLGAIALAGFIASCSGAPTVYNARIYHDAWPTFFSGSGQSEYLAVVWGNPFATEQAHTDAVVLNSVDRAYNRAGTSFSTNPETVDPLVPYVSVLFNPGSISSNLPCSDLANLKPGVVPGGEVRVHAALCRAGSALTGARGYVTDVMGPDDPRFHQLMHQVAVELFRQQPGSDIRRARDLDS